MLSTDNTDSDKSFENKRKRLFDCLENAEKDLKGSTLDQSKNENITRKLLKRSLDSDGSKSNADRNMLQLRGKESIFKKPEQPIAKCLRPRKTPDYQMNPHKWTKYSLADVDISDRTNTAAALGFLKEIETQKSKEENTETEDSDSKPVFNKAVTLKRILNNEDKDEHEKPKIKEGKFVMPEYVVGQKMKKDPKNNKSTSPQSSSDGKSTGGKQLMLSHLIEDNEEEEEGE